MGMPSRRHPLPRPPQPCPTSPASPCGPRGSPRRCQKVVWQWPLWARLRVPLFPNLFLAGGTHSSTPAGQGGHRPPAWRLGLGELGASQGTGVPEAGPGLSGRPPWLLGQNQQILATHQPHLLHPQLAISRPQCEIVCACVCTSSSKPVLGRLPSTPGTRPGSEQSARTTS